jgi:HK97 gp10 family phage protein
MTKSTIKGVGTTKSAFRQLQTGLAVPVNEASRKALRPTLAAAKANLKANGSNKTGALMSLLTIRRDPTSPKDKTVTVVAPSTKTPHYREAHLVEFGTAPHFEPKINHMHPGADPKPFMRPAFEETKEEVVKIFGDSIGPAVEKRAASLAKRANK